MAAAHDTNPLGTEFRFENPDRFPEVNRLLPDRDIGDPVLLQIVEILTRGEFRNEAETVLIIHFRPHERPAGIRDHSPLIRLVRLEEFRLSDGSRIDRRIGAARVMMQRRDLPFHRRVNLQSLKRFVIAFRPQVALHIAVNTSIKRRHHVADNCCHAVSLNPCARETAPGSLSITLSGGPPVFCLKFSEVCGIFSDREEKACPP